MAHDLRERITQELKHRGGWSIRKAAEEAAVKAAELGERAASNATLSRYMAGGELTSSVRRTFALAFDWENDWPENPPALRVSSVDPEAADLILAAISDSTAAATGVLRRIDRRLAAIERRLEVGSSHPVRRNKPSTER